MISNEVTSGVDIDKVRDVISVYQRNDFGELLRPYKNTVTLVIGISGAGKSTLCQLLADNPNLKAESEPGSYDFFITDGNNTISDSTITSKTYMPMLVPLKDKTALLDCPGFLDTRSNLHEIATSVFIKNVMEHLRSVKIVVVTSHHAVRKGVDRAAFLNLLNNLVGFVKSVKGYKHCIALVVNKVDVLVNPATMQLVPDEEVIKQIVAFLNEVRTELTASEAVSPRIELLDIFLNQEKDRFTSIRIVRRPTHDGPLSKIQTMAQQKANLESLIENLSSSPCNPTDFGMPLSEGARLCIFRTEEAISSEILEHLTEICDTILGHFMEINDSHWSDFFPLMGPKRMMFRQINRLIKKIGDRDGDEFRVTDLLTWLHIHKYDLGKVEDELSDIFVDYDFLTSVVDTDRDDHKKFFSQLGSLRKALKKLMDKSWYTRSHIRVHDHHHF